MDDDVDDDEYSYQIRHHKLLEPFLINKWFFLRFSGLFSDSLLYFSAQLMNGAKHSLIICEIDE